MRSSALLAAALLACASARADRVTDRMLSAIGVSAPKGFVLTAARPYQLRLVVGAPDTLKSALAGRYEAKREGDEVRVKVTGYVPMDGPVTEAHKKASFLVDFDEPVFAGLRTAVEARYGKTPTPEQLAAFTDGYITKKNYQRGDDLASVVASRKEGDCTEHAILLAALVRMFGGASRLVSGLALVSFEGRLYAFGHAWVEVGGEHGWRPLDPTRPTERVDGRWFPLSVTRDETMRYRAAAESDLLLVPSKVGVE